MRLFAVIRALFSLVTIAVITVAGIGVMVLFMGQATQITCVRAAGQVDCGVAKVVLGQVPLPVGGWSVDQVTRAGVQAACFDDCLYLETASGAKRPVTIDLAEDAPSPNVMAGQINAFIAAPSAPPLVLRNDGRARTGWLIVAGGLLFILAQVAVFVISFGRALVRRLALARQQLR